MKKIFALSLFLLLSYCFVSQAQSSRLLDLKNKFQGRSTPLSPSTWSNATKVRLDSFVELEYYRALYTYDLDSKIIDTYRYYWNRIDSIWELDLLFDNQYNDFGNEIKTTSFIWDSSKTNKIVQDVEEYVYNPQQQILKLNYFEKIDEKLEKLYTYTFFYNSKGQMEARSDSAYDRNNGTWVEAGKNSLSYDASGNVVLVDEFEFDEDSNKWFLSYRIESKYDQQNNLVQELERFIGSDNDTTRQYKSNYSYYPNNLLKESIYSNFDAFTMVFISNSKTEYRYDENANLLETIIYTPNQQSQWKKSNKEEYIYDFSFKNSDLYTPAAVPLEERNKNIKLSKIRYSWENNSQWVFIRSDSSYYSQLEVGFATKPFQAVYLIPNPANNQLKIVNALKSSSVDFELFDLMGRKVLSRTIDNAEYIDISGVPNGTYVYQLRTIGKSYTDKLIIQH